MAKGLPQFDKQIVDPKFAVQVVAVERFVNSSHLVVSHDSYCLQMQGKDILIRAFDFIVIAEEYNYLYLT